MKMDKKSLEEVINICIEKPLGGAAIDTKGQDMKDLIAYMKTLVTKSTKPVTKKVPKKNEDC